MKSRTTRPQRPSTETPPPPGASAGRRCAWPAGTATGDQVGELTGGRCCGVERGDRSPVAQNGYAVCDPQYLVEVVRDEQHARATGRRLTDELVDPLTLTDWEEPGRLVQHQDGGLVAGGARNRDQGRLERRQGIHPPGGIDFELEPGERLGRALVQPAPGDPAPPRRRQLVQADVFRHAQRWDQPQVLVHEAHPEGAGIVGPERQPRAARPNGQAPARRGRVIAGQDLDQRRLAGAVCPHEAVNLARPDVELGVRQRLHAGEALRDAARLEGDG